MDTRRHGAAGIGQLRDRGHDWLSQFFGGRSIPRDRLPAVGGSYGRRELHPSALLSQPLGIPSLERLGTLDRRRVRVGLPSAALQRQGRPVILSVSICLPPGLLLSWGQGRCLTEHWHREDLEYLGQFQSYRAFRQQRSTDDGGTNEAAPEPVSVEETPDAILEKAHGALNDELVAQILDEIADRSPAFFEKIVLDLMKAMGYGGWGEAAGRLTGAGADEGIDGLIHEDRLGLETIYLQAKRWAGSVGRPDIHKFVGALHGRRARKGVFMTTSTFTREAIDYAGQIDTKIVLVDGRTLARLMILHDVGCSPAQTYVVKKLDSDSFVED